MRVDNSVGKGTSGMDKFGSVIDKMNIKLGSKFLNYLRIKTQLLKRLLRVIVVDSATHSQKDGVMGSNKLLEGRRSLCCFCAAQRSAGSAVECLTVLDLDDVNVTLKNAEIFGSMLSGDDGSANGWRCC